MSAQWLLLALPFWAILGTALGAAWTNVCMDKIGGFWGFPLWMGGMAALVIVFIFLPVSFFLAPATPQ